MNGLPEVEGLGVNEGVHSRRLARLSVETEKGKLRLMVIV